LGTLSMDVRPEVDLNIDLENKEISFNAPVDSKKSKAFWGMTRALTNNLLEGVSKGFSKKLELVGVGYRAKAQGTGVNLSLGFSHPVVFTAPEGITINVIDEKNIEIKGINKELVGQVAANIRKIRPPEPYKGKGVRYSGEHVRRKAGKTGK
jgi:large subunit ribosomal protein L6